MKSIKAAVTGALLTIAVGGGILFAAAPASAATAPAWEPDPNANGTITFYDAAGNVQTGGNDLSHLFAYAAASSAEDPAGFKKASILFAFPDHTQPNTANWFSSSASAASVYPNTAAPAPINGLTNPVATTTGSGDVNLTAALGGAVLDTTAGYANIVQVRLVQSGGTNYWDTDISYNTATGTWQQIYPAVVTNTTTTLAATPNPSTVGDTVTLNATVTPAAAGTVQFQDGGTNVGSPVAVSAGTASITTSTLTAGSHALSAVFTPTDPTSYSGSTGNYTATVNPPATATTTTLSISGGYTTAGSAATLTATVSPSAASGSVAFYDNGSATAIAGTVTNPTAGTYVLDLPSGFIAGGHSLVAKFTPTDVTVYQVSQSAPQSFLTQAPVVGACANTSSQCTTTANVQATVPVGTLVISTPYTASAPLDLGTLALSADSKTLSASKPFQHIVVTDTRSGNLPWTVQAIASNLSDGGSNPNSVINAQNLGLTGVAQVSAGAGFVGVLTATDNAAANGVAPGDTGSLGLGGTAPHTVVSTDHGLGTVDMSGTLELIAPSSTEPGLFTGTITFTVG